MVWSFIWRWVLASVVLTPIALFSFGFVVGLLTGDDAATPANLLVAVAALVGAAAWAFTSARRAR